MLEINDVAIIGSGPAGLQAALTAASELPRVIVIEKKGIVGGQAATSSHIENIAGHDATGGALVNKMYRNARKHGARFIFNTGVDHIEQQGTVHAITLENGSYVLAKTVLIATGLRSKRIEIDGEAQYLGTGVFYDSVLSKVRACKGLPLAIVGGGNSAGQLALYASRFASSVAILVRSEGIAETMSSYLVQQIAADPKITVIDHAQVKSVKGDVKLLRSLTYTRFDKTEEVAACALFVLVGQQPVTKWLPEQITIDRQGFIVADGPLKHETAVPGVFAIGDVNASSVKRVGGAIGQGTEVIPSIHEYLAGKEFSL